MTKTFKLQDPGEGIHEAEILDIKVSEGDDVQEGDILLEIETDKAAVEIPSPFTGTIKGIDVAVGDRARVGESLITYSDSGDADGRTSDDKGASAVDEDGAESRTARDHDDTPIPASPATRRLARELDVDIRNVTPTGPEGRVTSNDVRTHAADGEDEAKTQKETGGETAVDFSQWGTVRRDPLRSIRRATARKMTTSWSNVPHVTHADVADITELEQFRNEYKAAVEKEGGKLTITVLVLKAAVAALKAFPRFNASLDPAKEEIVYKEYFHIGVAVATDRGLLVPVVRDADAKSAIELAVELQQLADRARAGELARKEMQGGSFTITNPGGIGGTGFTPIINHPEVAILGLGAAKLQPVIQGSRDDFAVVPRLLLPLCLAFDHRMNDGAGAARFTRKVVEVLENPEFLTLNA